MKNKLFLSNSEIVDQQFLHFCQSHDTELVARSLIDFRAVPFDLRFEADVIFFSSPRSVDFYFQQTKDPQGIFTCIGEGTAKRLSEWGKEAGFIGIQSGNPEEVAKDFLTWLGNRRVLFPLSGSSNRSVSKWVPVNQRCEVTVYETFAAHAQIEACALYVFTSPSNVDAFLLENELPSDAKIIAWGTTTESKLKALKIKVYATLKDSSLRGLETVLSALWR